MTEQEQDAMLRENNRLKMALVRSFRELDPSTMLDTHSPVDHLCELHFMIRNQLRLLTLETAR